MVFPKLWAALFPAGRTVAGRLGFHPLFGQSGMCTAREASGSRRKEACCVVNTAHIRYMNNVNNCCADITGVLCGRFHVRLKKPVGKLH